MIRAVDRRGQPKGCPHPGWGRPGQGQCSAVGGGHLTSQRKAKAETASAADPFARCAAPGEPIRQSLRVLTRQAFSVIADGEQDPWAAVLDGDGDMPTRRGVSHRVVHEGRQSTA
jgi:hypothetical protein